MAENCRRQSTKNNAHNAPQSIENSMYAMSFGCSTIDGAANAIVETVMYVCCLFSNNDTLNFDDKFYRKTMIVFAGKHSIKQCDDTNGLNKQKRVKIKVKNDE